MGDIEMKTLSFIIPLYNSAQWLQKCLYSVLNQDIPESELEIICINDGELGADFERVKQEVQEASASASVSSLRRQA